MRDPAFTSGDPFFDPRDLLQVKYEMVRRVHLDGQPVTTTATAFGFSRPSFYAALPPGKRAVCPLCYLRDQDHVPRTNLPRTLSSSS